jgi:biotin carboxylase
MEQIIKKKKLLLLGALKYLIPVIESAQNLNVHVITCDNNPQNIAHKFSDEQWYISILEKNAILDKCKIVGIDGIMSFAVDPGVLTAAFISENLDIPGVSLEAAYILQNKDRFREFLRQNGFNAPQSVRITDTENLNNKVSGLRFPLFVKPADSAGSKGVSRIDNIFEIESSVINAMKYSFSATVIIEEYIDLDGYQSDSDCFALDGKLVFSSFSSQFFDTKSKNPFVPCAFAWPSKFGDDIKKMFHCELQRLITLLGIETSIFNVEVRVSRSGTPFIMEVSPRGGGNRLSEMLRHAYGVDLISASVSAALGEEPEIKFKVESDGFWTEVILFSRRDGLFDSLTISDWVERNYLVEKDLWVKRGDIVRSFVGANDSIGTLVLKFSTEEEQDYYISNREEWLQVKLKNLVNG